MAVKPTVPWQVYIVVCADDSLYTGIARDLGARIELHNAGQGAKYTRSRRPVRLLYREAATSRSVAQQREHAIRRLSPAKKWALIHAAGKQRDPT